MQFCREVGVNDINLFSASDLVEGKDARRVCLCLRILSYKVRDVVVSSLHAHAHTSLLKEPYPSHWHVSRSLKCQAICSFISFRDSFIPKHMSGNIVTAVVNQAVEYPVGSGP
jgi:hypothetical protein